MGWRAFRHTVAALLQNLGEPVKVEQEQLGNSTPYTTLSNYAPLASTLAHIENRQFRRCALVEPELNPFLATGAESRQQPKQVGASGLGGTLKNCAGFREDCNAELGGFSSLLGSSELVRKAWKNGHTAHSR